MMQYTTRRCVRPEGPGPLLHWEPVPRPFLESEPQQPPGTERRHIRSAALH